MRGRIIKDLIPMRGDGAIGGRVTWRVKEAGQTGVKEGFDDIGADRILG